MRKNCIERDFEIPEEYVISKENSEELPKELKKIEEEITTTLKEEIDSL